MFLLKKIRTKTLSLGLVMVLFCLNLKDMKNQILEQSEDKDYFTTV